VSPRAGRGDGASTESPGVDGAQGAWSRAEDGGGGKSGVNMTRVGTDDVSEAGGGSGVSDGARVVGGSDSVSSGEGDGN